MLTLEFAPGTGLDIESQDFTATDITFSSTGSGWNGIDFASGANATLNGGTIEEVNGWGGYAVDIENGAARVEINDTVIQNALSPSYVSGIRVSGDAHDVTLTGETVSVRGATISSMTGDGIVLTSRAQARLSDNTIIDNGGDGLLVGFHSEAFFGRHRTSTSSETTNRVSGNGGYGGYSTASGNVTTGFYYFPADCPYSTGYYTEYPEGYNLVIKNQDGGLHAANSGRFSAGINAVQGQLANNSILENGGPGSQWFDGFGPDASIAGTSTSGHARYDWWGRSFSPDVTPSVIVDPILTSAPSSSAAPPTSSASDLAAKSDGSLPEQSARTAYVTAVERRDASLLSTLVHAVPGTPEAAQALSHLGHLAGRGLLSETDVPLAMSVLRTESLGRRADHRAWALVGLVQAHDLRGEPRQALTAATALVEEGGETEVYGLIARAHLLRDLGDRRSAEADLAAVTALVPESREVRLVAEALGLSVWDTPQGLQAENALEAKRAHAAEPSHVLGTPYPNPSAGDVRFPFSLSDQTSVTLVIYDALGREVSTLASGVYEGGHHTAHLRRGLAPGLYIARLRIEGHAPRSERFTVTQLPYPCASLSSSPRSSP